MSSSHSIFNPPEKVIEELQAFITSVSGYKKEHKTDSLYDDLQKKIKTERNDTSVDFEHDIINNYARIKVYIKQTQKQIESPAYRELNAMAIEPSIKNAKYDVKLFKEAKEVKQEEKDLCDTLLTDLDKLATTFAAFNPK